MREFLIKQRLFSTGLTDVRHGHEVFVVSQSDRVKSVPRKGFNGNRPPQKRTKRKEKGGGGEDIKVAS